jgi:23S rRNA (uridine2552-2'-O)-methyltransferase
VGRRKRKTRHWIADKERDPYTRQARASGYRSRAAFKLQQIDEKDHLFKGTSRVLDLGSAPGGWSQYARDKISRGSVVAVDILPMEPVEGVTFLQEDFTDEAVQARLLELVSPNSYDLVISDMAPNITGIVDADQANAAALAERAIGFSARVLGKGGIALVKLFEGGEALRIRRLGETLFYRSVVRKPQASRDKSREIYLLLRQPRA